MTDYQDEEVQRRKEWERFVLDFKRDNSKLLPPYTGKPFISAMKEPGSPDAKVIEQCGCGNLHICEECGQPVIVTKDSRARLTTDRRLKHFYVLLTAMATASASELEVSGREMHNGWWLQDHWKHGKCPVKKR